MDKFILVDIETQGFCVEDGIYEVGAVFIENLTIKDRIHIGIIEDESLIDTGYGQGYKNISYNRECIDSFKNFLEKYKVPLVAHNAPFDKKFLEYYQWIENDYPVYDSIRAIKNSNPGLKSYSLSYLEEYTKSINNHSHNAMEDIELTLEIIKYFNPQKWFAIGEKSDTVKNKKYIKYEKLTSIKEEFEVIENLFLGKNIVFTGKSQYSRNMLIELAKKGGAVVTSNNITKKTDILVVGKEAGSKLVKAKQMGIEVMPMSEFIEKINSIKSVS